LGIPFSPRAALCTAVVLVGFGALASPQMPGGFAGLVGFDREGLLPITTGGREEADEQQDILGAVLTQEALNLPSGNVCLELAKEGATFASEQQAMTTLAGEMSRDPAARSDIAARLDRMRNPVRSWVLPAANRGESEPQPLSEEGARQLRTAETTLLTSPRPARVEILLDSGNIPARFQSRAAGCATLFFTAPGIAGDLAFVETSYRGPSGAQADRLYAVVKREERWEVAALAPVS